MDSRFAASMKPHVLTRMTSACPRSVVCSAPWARSSARYRSVSTVFLSQPRVTRPTFTGGGWGGGWRRGWWGGGRWLGRGRWAAPRGGGGAQGGAGRCGRWSWRGGGERGGAAGAGGGDLHSRKVVVGRDSGIGHGREPTD